MAYLKTAIGLTLAFIGAVLVLMLATFDTNHELNLAEESFLKGEYAEAEARLNRIAFEIPQDRLLLYKAYLIRQQGNLKASSQDLQEAFNYWSKQSGYSRLGLEIAINQALNAYLSDSDHELSQSLNQMKNLPLRSQEWEEFFSGLLAMQKNNCREALKQWKSLRELPSYSQWMQRGVVELFPEFRKSLQQVHCLIQVGEVAIARDRLESLKQHQLNPEQIEEIELLIGKSYLVEAESRPVALRQVYYKSAFGMLSRVPLQSSRYKKERNEILKQVENTIEDLVKGGSLQELPFYISLLQNWNAQSSLQKISFQLMTQIETALSQNDSSAIHSTALALNRLLPEGTIREQLSEGLEKSLLESIQKGNVWQTAQIFEAAVAFEGDAELFRTKVSARLKEEIFKTLQSDDAHLTATTPFLIFWEKLTPQDPLKLGMAKELLKTAQEEWRQGEESKALKLTKSTLRLVPWNDQANFKSELETAFLQLYTFTLREKRVTALPLLQEAVNDFDLKDLKFTHTQDIAFLLDEANYLAANGREQEAQLFLEWVLAVNPQNPQALALAATLAYLGSDYKTAEKYLTQLSILPKESLEAFAVSRMINSPFENRGDWERFTQKNVPTPEAYLRLAVEAFKAHRIEESLAWLQKVNPNQPEAKIVAAMIHHQATSGLLPEGYKIPNYLK